MFLSIILKFRVPDINILLGIRKKATVFDSTVAAILRSSVIGSQSVKGCEGFKPMILFIWCHVHSASFIILARVEGVLVSSVVRVSSVARVSSAVL